MKKVDEMNIEVFKAMFDEVMERKKSQEESMMFLRDTSKTFFGSSSVIISIVGTFNLISPKIEENYISFYNVLAAVTILFYVGLVFCAIKGYLPVNMYTAFDNDYSKLLNEFWGKSTEDILQRKISNYIDALDKNTKFVVERTNYVKIAGILFAVIVVLLLVMSLIPRTAPI